MIVGPTGVGKSNLGIRIARQFNGEIVNGDSRQIYRYMDIGTAKPSQAELQTVPHHLFNIIDPDQDYNLAQYQKDANSIIHAIQNRRKLPILVGGSGQYIMGLLEGWQVPQVAPDNDLRKSLEKQAEQNIDELYLKLKTLDPDSAGKIDKRNVRRVIRALEVCLQTGRPFSKIQSKHPPDYHTLMLGLTMDRKELYKRTDMRTEEMFRQGLLSETKKLMQLGYHENLPSMSSIGYRQAIQVIRNELSEKTAIIKVQNETHRYIRHQYAWFSLQDPRIKWFDAGQELWPEITRTIREFIKSRD